MDNLLKALRACGEQFQDSSFTVVDMHSENQPLVYVNQHFLKMTGYPKEEIMNKNCRFLQAGQSNQNVLKSLRSCLKKGVACYHDLINYKKDGSPFWNRLCLFPVEHEVVGLKYFVGIQLDVTKLKEQHAPQKLADFVNDEHLTQEVHDQIENPLDKLMQNTQALKYFVDDDPESLVQRKKIAAEVSAQVGNLTRYVASLKV